MELISGNDLRAGNTLFVVYFERSMRQGLQRTLRGPLYLPIILNIRNHIARNDDAKVLIFAEWN